MTFTPHITIYPEGDFNYSWFGDTSVRATLIFSKNLYYNKNLFRKRVNIHLGDEERVHTDSSIKSIWIKNNLNTSQELSDVEKINIFLKIIYHSVTTIAEIEGWDTTAFEKAYQLSIADNGNCIWYSQLKANKNRTIKARIKISLDTDSKVPIIAEFFDNKSTPQFKIPIIDTYLHFVDWERIFEKPIWLDNEKFGFNFLNSQLLIFANISSKQSETIISGKSWTRDEIEGHLRRLSYKRFTSDNEFVEWANK
jgi:hypothetical protein